MKYYFAENARNDGSKELMTFIVESEQKVYQLVECYWPSGNKAGWGFHDNHPDLLMKAVCKADSFVAISKEDAILKLEKYMNDEVSPYGLQIKQLLSKIRNGNYFVTGHINPFDEIEREFEDLSNAMAYAGALIENGSSTQVFSGDGETEYNAF